MNSLELRRAIRAKYAWPGGYPLYCIMSDSEPMCMECAKKDYKMLAQAHQDPRDQWHVAAVEINYENTDLQCCACGEHIESAYAEDKT